MRRVFLLFLFLVIGNLLCPNWGRAAEISLNVMVSAKDEDFSTIVTNRGKDIVSGVYIDTDVSGLRYSICLQEPIKPGEKFEFHYRVPARRDPGSYPVIADVSYELEGHRLGVTEAAPIFYRFQSTLPVTCAAAPVSMREQTEIHFVKPPKFKKVTTRIATPAHVQSAVVNEVLTDGTAILVVPDVSFRSQGMAHLIFETHENGVHSTGICSLSLTTLPKIQSSSWYSSRFLFGTAFLSICAAFYFFVRNPHPNLELTARIRWLFSLSLCSFFYLAFRVLGILPDQLAPIVSWYEQIHFLHPQIASSLRFLLERLYFLGSDYEAFFGRIADPLYTFMLFGNYFFLRFIGKPSPEEDKYWHLMVSWFRSIFFRSFIRMTAGANGRKVKDFAYSPQLKKVALLSYAVKLFFLPMLWSWAIANAGQMMALFNNPPKGFFPVTKALIEAMIFLDVSIFAIGYTIEFSKLKNVIKSVEPTVLGWVVCLLCYPPFNKVFFSPFDRSIFPGWPVWSEETRQIVTVAVVVLWSIYTWASVALAMKASNLTNRGIVGHGPYRFVRHPAYAGKVFVWLLSAIFLGEGFGLNVCAAIVVYSLRAITEERHLMSDPDYVEYRKKVKWMFIPGII